MSFYDIKETHQDVFLNTLSYLLPSRHEIHWDTMTYSEWLHTILLLEKHFFLLSHINKEMRTMIHEGVQHSLLEDIGSPEYVIPTFEFGLTNGMFGSTVKTRSFPFHAVRHMAFISGITNRYFETLPEIQSLRSLETVIFNYGGIIELDGHTVISALPPTFKRCHIFFCTNYLSKLCGGILQTFLTASSKVTHQVMGPASVINVPHTIKWKPIFLSQVEAIHAVTYRQKVNVDVPEHLVAKYQFIKDMDYTEQKKYVHRRVYESERLIDGLQPKLCFMVRTAIDNGIPVEENEPIMKLDSIITFMMQEQKDWTEMKQYVFAVFDTLLAKLDE
jgi:hypothetical protein